MSEIRNLIVTGGATGIGRATALRWARDGGGVGIIDTNIDAAREVAGLALARGARAALAVPADVRSEIEVQNAVDNIAETLGGVSHGFANAGIDRGGRLHELPIGVWDSVITTNLTGVFLTCKHILRHMTAAKIPGAIVCTASPLAYTAIQTGGMTAYSAAKGGIIALARAAAIEYAADNIRINTIIPGATETALMWANVPPRNIPDIRTSIDNIIPMGHLASPDEIAAAVAWLLSPQSSYVTGSTLVCDGGILALSALPA